MDLASVSPAVWLVVDFAQRYYPKKPKDHSLYLANGVPACKLRQRRWQRSRIFIHASPTPPNTPDEQRPAEAALASLGFAFVFQYPLS